MLSDEEKQAIEYWKTHMEILHWNTQLASEHYIKVLLDLVEKQQKEIEELKNGQIDFWISDKEIEERIRNKFVSKDKIKAKIKEIELLIDNSQGCMSNEDLYKEYGKIEFGKSLLEKE